MNQGAQVALYAAMTGGLLAAGLAFYGAGYKHGVWAITFGFVVFVALFGVGYLWLAPR